MKRRPDSGLSRRAFLGAAGAATAGAMVTTTATAGATSAGGVPAGGEYPRVALRSECVTVGLMQTRSLAVDGRRPCGGLQRNLEHLCSSIDAAQADGGHKDWLAFHELPLSGWDHWSRRELARVAIDLPGPETAAIATKAREHDCYVSFGAFVRDPEWPGHVLSVTAFISPAGELVAKQWRLRREPGTATDAHVSTVDDVLDEFVERHGWDAVVPVVRTDIGNLAATALADEPELYRAMALKGAEFLLRVAAGATPARVAGASGADLAVHDLAVWCRANRIYGGFVNSAVDAQPAQLVDLPGGGGSTVFGPDGRALGEPRGQREEVVAARLPLAAFRRTHRLPQIPAALATTLTQLRTGRRVG